MCKSLSMLLTVSSILFVSACGASALRATAPTAAPTVNQVAVPTTAAAAPTSGPIVIKDDKRALSFDTPPTRVVACTEEAIDFLITLGVQPIAICSGRTEGATTGTPFTRPYFFPKEKLGTPTYVGTDSAPSLERIALLKPDLIISGVWSEEANTKMAAIAPLFTIDPAVPGYWREPLTELAKVFKREAQAQQFLDEYDATAKRLSEQLAPMAQRTPNVLFIYSYAASDGTVLLGPNWTGSKPFELFGFKVLKPDGYDLSSGAVPVSTEIVSQVPADIVFMLRIKAPDGTVPHYPIDDLVASLKNTRVIYQNVASTRGSTAPYTDRFVLEEIGGLLLNEPATSVVGATSTTP